MTKLNVLEMIKTVKAKGWKIILGGPEPASYAKEFIDYGADVVVVGEGEITLHEVIENISAKSVHRLDNVDGIVFRDEQGKIVHTKPRTLIEDLDSLSLPDREAIHLEEYLTTWKTHHGFSSLSLITARGCPYTCNWCSHSVYGETHRRRSVASAVQEIQLLKERYNPDALWFADDVLTIHHKWFFRFRDEMKRRKLKIPFECITRADRMNPDIVDALKELGCYRVWIGSESGSQKILDAMERGVTTHQVEAMTKLARAKGIDVGMFIMFGYQGEGISEIDETVEHLKRSNPNIFFTTVAYPIKGTKYWGKIENSIHSPFSWPQRTDRDLKVSSQYSKSFYWFTKRYVVNEVKHHSLMQNGSNHKFESAASLMKSKIARLGMSLTQLFSA